MKQKEVEIYRMNFLQQGMGQFTYRTMLRILVGWLVFLAVLYGSTFVRQFLLKREIAIGKKSIETLTREKDRQLELMKVASKQRDTSTVTQDLKEILEQRPVWWRVLDNFTASLPSNVWLDAVQSSQSTPGNYALTISGKAKSQRDITNFIMQLESGGMFKGTTLAKTKQMEGIEGVIEYEIMTYPIMAKF